jgi:hypothetical protein
MSYFTFLQYQLFQLRVPLTKHTISQHFTLGLQITDNMLIGKYVFCTSLELTCKKNTVFLLHLTSHMDSQETRFHKFHHTSLHAASVKMLHILHYVS